MITDRILAVDVGAGTQDILLWEASQPADIEPDRPPDCPSDCLPDCLQSASASASTSAASVENNVKLVLPSWTTILARRVEQATKEGRPVFLTGNLMGGGPIVRAMKRHLRAGYPVYTTPRAALTIRDNLDQVRERGYTILREEEDPPGASDLLTLRTRDVDLEAIKRALVPFGVSLPETFAVAVQDHGECLEGSNRKFRFQLWREFVEGGGHMLGLAYLEPPPCYTRMRAVQQDAPGAVVMDTGPAALWGILQDKHAAAYRDEGFIALNVGNQHTLGVLLRGERMLGLFEHHTVLMTPRKLAGLIDQLRAGTLTNEEVYADHGHGAYIHPDYAPGAGFDFVAVTGPQRHLTADLGHYFAAPYGDMMLTGCFGLVAATLRLAREKQACQTLNPKSNISNLGR